MAHGWTGLREEWAAAVQIGLRAPADSHCGQGPQLRLPLAERLCGPGAKAAQSRVLEGSACTERAWGFVGLPGPGAELAVSGWPLHSGGSGRWGPRTMPAAAPDPPLASGLSTWWGGGGGRGPGPAPVAGWGLAFALLPPWPPTGTSPSCGHSQRWPCPGCCGLGVLLTTSPPLPPPPFSLVRLLTSSPSDNPGTLNKCSHSLICLLFCALVLCFALHPHGRTLFILELEVCPF